MPRTLIIRKRPVNPSYAAVPPGAYLAASHGHGARVHSAEVSDGWTANGRGEAGAVAEVDGRGGAGRDVDSGVLPTAAADGAAVLCVARASAARRRGWRGDAP